MKPDPLTRIHAVFNHPELRKTLLRIRKPLGAAAAILLVCFLDPAWFVPGLIVSAAGAVLQWWCFGCIDTGRTLAVNGPYKAVRNPMYLARFILVLGCTLFSGTVWLPLTFTALYGFYMVNRVHREEQKLVEVFGAPYEEYRKRVHAYVPFVGIAPGGRFLYFNAANFRRNHGRTNAAAVTLFYVISGIVALLRESTG